jgi:transcriptional regulator with XRE-family HTH domain
LAYIYAKEDLMKSGNTLIDILGRPDGHCRYRFPSLVKAERLRLGWTQEDAAVALGMSRSTYRQLEEGRNDPRLSTLIRLVRLGYRLRAIVPELAEYSDEE